VASGAGTLSALTRIAGVERENEPSRGEIEIEPEFDRQRPQRAVEFVLERHGLEHARQRIAHAAKDRRAFGEIFPGFSGAEKIGERQRSQRRGEAEDGQREHDPERRIDAQRPRPKVGDEIPPVDKARGDEKTAGDKEDVDRHLRQREPEMVEEELAAGWQSQNRDTMAEEDRERRQEADEVEIVVPPDGVVGKSHSALPSLILRHSPSKDGRLRRPAAPRSPAQAVERRASFDALCGRGSR
jgi:hypothetical protein